MAHPAGFHLALRRRKAFSAAADEIPREFLAIRGHNMAKAAIEAAAWDADGNAAGNLVERAAKELPQRQVWGASASQAAASMAALAMLWPRIGERISHTSAAAENSLRASAGQMKSRRMSHAVSMVSGE